MPVVFLLAMCVSQPVSNGDGVVLHGMGNAWRGAGAWVMSQGITSRFT